MCSQSSSFISHLAKGPTQCCHIVYSVLRVSLNVINFLGQMFHSLWINQSTSLCFSCLSRIPHNFWSPNGTLSCVYVYRQFLYVVHHHHSITFFKKYFKMQTISWSGKWVHECIHIWKMKIPTFWISNTFTQFKNHGALSTDHHWVIFVITQRKRVRKKKSHSY